MAALVPAIHVFSNLDLFWQLRWVGKGAQRRAHVTVARVGFAALSPPYEAPSPHIHALARVAARRHADGLDRAENPPQVMDVGTRANDPRRLVGLIDVGIGLEMRDQLGVGIDRVANAPVAERSINVGMVEFTMENIQVFGEQYSLDLAGKYSRTMIA